MSAGDLFPVVVTALLLAAAAVFLWNERQRQERVDAENDMLRHENMRLMAGSVRLVAQVESLGAIPAWRPFSEQREIGSGSDLLVRALSERFTREELALVAHEIGIDIEEVGGQTLSAMALRLAEAARHRGLADKLAEAVRKARPGVMG